MSSSPTPLNSPQQQSSSSTQDMQRENVEDRLNKPFPILDQNSIAAAFDAEAHRLTEFEAEFSDMLLSAMLEVRAWALARPAAEQESTQGALQVQLTEVRKTEDEQGRFSFLEQTRLRLLNFIKSIKSALEALTDI